MIDPGLPTFFFAINPAMWIEYRKEKKWREGYRIREENKQAMQRDNSEINRVRMKNGLEPL
jgi:hypothetical protein